jgi:hypothetical protein
MTLAQSLINRGLKLLSYPEKKRITGTRQLYLEAPQEQKLLNTCEKKLITTVEKRLITMY